MVDFPESRETGNPAKEAFTTSRLRTCKETNALGDLFMGWPIVGETDARLG